MKNFFKKHGRIIFYIIIIVAAIIFPFYALRLFLEGSIINDPEKRLDIIALVVSIYSLETSVIIAFLIMDLQNYKADREKKDRIATAKHLMLAAIEDGIYKLISTPEYRTTGTSKDIKEIFTEYRNEFATSLSPKYYNLLSSVTFFIDSFVTGNITQEDYPNVWSIFPMWIDQIRNSQFLDYMIMATDPHDLLTNDMFELVRLLDTRKENVTGKHDNIEGKQAKVHGNMGWVLFERDGDRVIIRDDKNHVVADGTFDENEYEADGWEIRDGYIETDEYSGFVKDYEYSGKGKTFNSKHEVIAEGTWVQGELVEGIKHRCIVIIPHGKANTRDYWTDPGTCTLFRLVGQYDELWNEDASIDVRFGANKDNINEFYVVDLKLEQTRYEIIKDTRVALRHFLTERHNDELLDDILGKRDNPGWTF